MVGNISISGVSKHFINPTGERITALDNVSLEIPSGSFVSLIGPSGCGKSTLLRLISGLIQMDEGELTLDGVPVTAPGADRGFMFQEHTLFPWLSIYDNIAFGLRARGIYKQEKDRVDEFIEMVGLKGFAAGVIGGFGNTAGALLGGLLLGVVENLACMVVPSTYKDVIAFALLIVFLMLKPGGLISQKKD